MNMSRSESFHYEGGGVSLLWSENFYFQGWGGGGCPITRVNFLGADTPLYTMTQGGKA